MNICCRKQLLQFSQHYGQRWSLIQLPFVVIQEHRSCQISQYYHRWLSLRLLIGIQQENHPSALQLARPATNGKTSICTLFYRLILYPQKMLVEWWEIRSIMRDIEDYSQLTIMMYQLISGKKNRCTYNILGRPSFSVTEGFCTIQQSGTGDS